MEHSQKHIGQYLKMYPHLHKWINRCPLCSGVGRKPEMPDVIGSINGEIAVENLKRMLPVLEVNENSFCPVCARLYPLQK